MKFLAKAAKNTIDTKVITKPKQAKAAAGHTKKLKMESGAVCSFYFESITGRAINHFMREEKEIFIHNTNTSSGKFVRKRLFYIKYAKTKHTKTNDRLEISATAGPELHPSDEQVKTHERYSLLSPGRFIYSQKSPKCLDEQKRVVPTSP